MNLNECTVLQCNDIPPYRRVTAVHVAVFQVGELPFSQYEKTSVKVDTGTWGYKKGNQHHTQTPGTMWLYFFYINLCEIGTSWFMWSMWQESGCSLQVWIWGYGQEGLNLPIKENMEISLILIKIILCAHLYMFKNTLFLAFASDIRILCSSWKLLLAQFSNLRLFKSARVWFLPLLALTEKWDWKGMSLSWFQLG